MECTIRPATENDVPQILQFIKALAEFEHMADQVVATEQDLTKWIFAEKKVEVIICEAQGNPVGFALYFTNFSTFIGKPGIYLEDLFVLPAYRGNGFGKLILKRLAEITVERDYGRLEWACLDWNEPSIQFYRSLGAEPMNDWTVYRLSGSALTGF